MEIFFYRHGKTAGNLEKRYIGAKTDEPLCCDGIKEAQSKVCFPEVTKVYVSPMLRVRQTAEILFPNAFQIPVEDLREMDFGSFEGKNFEDLKQDDGYIQWVSDHCVGTCPEGEDKNRFTDRCAEAFCSIVEKELQAGAQNVYVVAHGGTIMSVMYTFSKDSRDYFQWYVENLGCYRITVEKELWQKERKFLRENSFQEDRECCG